MGIYKTGITCLAEQVPTAASYMLIERGSDDGRANVARTTTDKCWLRNEMQTVRVFKILQVAQRLVFVGPPTI